MGSGYRRKMKPGEVSWRAVVVFEHPPGRYVQDETGDFVKSTERTQETVYVGPYSTPQPAKAYITEQRHVWEFAKEHGWEDANRVIVDAWIERSSTEWTRVD